MENLTNNLAIIISGIIAILSLIVSPLTNLLVYQCKWKKEHKIRIQNRITDSTIELITILGHFNTPENDDDNVEIAGGKNFLSVYADLRKSYFIWESSIFIKAKKNERDQIKIIREKINNSPYSLRELIMKEKLLDSILEITNQIYERIK